MRWKCTDELADALVHRPVAGVIARALRDTRVTPNHLTLLSMGLGVCAGLYLALGHPAAAALIVAHLVFDCADGQLARMRRPSRLGRILDGLSDDVAGIAMYAGLVAAGVPLLLALLSGASLLLRGFVFDGLKALYQGAAVIPVYTRLQWWLLGDAAPSERMLRAAGFVGPTTHHVLLAASAVSGHYGPFLLYAGVLANVTLALLMAARYVAGVHYRRAGVVR